MTKYVTFDVVSKTGTCQVKVDKDLSDKEVENIARQMVQENGVDAPENGIEFFYDDYPSNTLHFREIEESS